MVDVLVAGVAVADFVMKVSEFPRQAKKYIANDATFSIGGCAANAAVAISRHGGTARLAARLGQDDLGALIVATLEREGVDLSLSDRRAGAQSSFSSVIIDAAGERQIVNFRGTGLAETIELSSAPRPGAVLADNRQPALVAAAVDAARSWGVPCIIDAEAPVTASALHGATHIAFSLQGLQDYAPELSMTDALERARDEFGAWTAATAGAEGVWFTAGDHIDHIPAFVVDAVDTLGAGDVWHGVFALRLAEGASEHMAIRFANAAAALKCRTFGGATSCPQRAETEQFIKEYA